MLRARRDLPPRPREGDPPGRLVRVRPPAVHDHDRLPQGLPGPRALPLHDRRGRARAAAAPARPGHRPAGQRRVPGRRDRALRVPARGVRQARDRHLPRRLPARQPAAAGAGGAALRRRHDPAHQALRAAAGRVPGRHVPAVLHPGPGLVDHVLRRLPGDPLRGHEPLLVRAGRAPDVRRRGVGDVPPARPHPGPRGDLAEPVLAAAGRAFRLPDRAVPVRAGRRRAVRYRLRRGAAVGGRHVAAAGRRHRPHLLRDRQRARARRRLRAAARLPPVHRARDEGGDGRLRLVLEAAGRRASRRCSRCRCS